MRILFITDMGKNKIMETNILPRAGDKVDMFWHPYPVVTQVLLYPSKETMELFGLNGHLDAIVTLN